jgi:LacI family transcriptional regulator
MISGPEGNFDADERLRGYTETLARLAPRAKPQVLRGDFSEESGQRAGREIADMRKRPEAVFAANDMMAIGCLLGLAGAGVSVPRDVALAGFDDIPAARYVNPPLTTVRVRIAELGESAFDRLMRAVERRGKDKPTQQLLATELVVRRSCNRSSQSK